MKIKKNEAPGVKKRTAYCLYDQGRIAKEAFSVPRNIHSTARKYKIGRNQIRRWKKAGLDKDYEAVLIPDMPLRLETDAVRANQMNENHIPVFAESDIVACLKKQKVLMNRRRISKGYRLKGGGRKAIFAHRTRLELFGFFLEMRDHNMIVSTELMRCHAKIIDPAACIDVSDIALDHRLHRLKTQWGASNRKGTHKAQLTRFDYNIMRDFNTYIRVKCETLGICPEAVYNFDKTNIYFAPSLDYTWDVKGRSSIGIANSKSSGRCTAMLGSSMTGEKVTPFVILTASTTRNGTIKKEVEQPKKYGYTTNVVYDTQERGWMDTERMLNWIKNVWSPISKQHEVTMLVLDSFTAHFTSPVLQALVDCNTELEIVPAGYTSKLQPMDVGVNKPFKDRFRKQYSNLVTEHHRAKSKAKVKRQDVAAWIDIAWNDIHPQIFRNAFHGSGFDIASGVVPNSSINIHDENNEHDGIDILDLLP